MTLMSTGAGADLTGATGLRALLSLIAAIKIFFFFFGYYLFLVLLFLMVRILVCVRLAVLYGGMPAQPITQKEQTVNFSFFIYAFFASFSSNLNFCSIESPINIENKKRRSNVSSLV